MKPLFVDSGYWVALENVDDQNHLNALSRWQKLRVAIPRLVTTS
jgi:predicted nucleic acid-binding protein